MTGPVSGTGALSGAGTEPETGGRDGATGPRQLLWQVPAVLAAALVATLAVFAVLRPAASLVPQPRGWLPASLPAAFLPTPNNNLLVVLLVVLLVLVFWSRLATRADERLHPAHWAAAAALVTVLLGVTSYSPCLGEESVAGLVAGTLRLFGGEIGEASFGADGACPGPLPLGLQVARMLGVATSVLAVLATVLFVLTNQVDRWWVRRARDVDVVVGLDAASLALMRVLVRERRRGRTGEWSGHPGSGRPDHRHAGVVLVHPNPDDAAVGEVRRMGVRVVIGDPLSPRMLRRVLTWGRGSRASVRRLFAVTGSQADNIAIVEAAGRILADLPESAPDGSRAVVPRLIARFEDPREAHDWRVARVDSRGCFIDALSSDGLLARQIVERITAAGCPRVVIDGDSALSVEVLNEIVLQRCFRHERDVAEAVRSGRAPHGADPSSPAGRVTVTGPRGALVVEEWRRHCPPEVEVGAGPVVDADPEDLEVVVARTSVGEALTAVVLTGPYSAAGEARSIRISRLHPSTYVLTPGATTVGIEADDQGGWPGRHLVRYGPTLLEGHSVPEDSWTLLARQGHEVYVAGRQDGRMARRPWGGPDDPAGTRLPGFYREDNLRQLRRVLSGVVEHGFDWLPVSVDSVRLEGPDDHDLEEIARSEHERWCALRTGQGWTHTPPPPEGLDPDERLEVLLGQERSCRNPNLVDWDTGAPLPARSRSGAGPRPRPGSRSGSASGAHAGTVGVGSGTTGVSGVGGGTVGEGGTDEDLRALRDFNVEMVRSTIERLRMWGIEPQGRYERAGTVNARRLEETLEWSVPSGDHFVADPGDWVVTDGSGRERVVKAAEFAELHVPTGEPGVYRRAGTVHAGRIAETGTVTSLEGDQTARAGDWLVTDPRGNSWPVPADHFARTYRKVEPASSAEER